MEAYIGLKLLVHWHSRTVPYCFTLMNKHSGWQNLCIVFLLWYLRIIIGERLNENFWKFQNLALPDLTNQMLNQTQIWIALENGRREGGYKSYTKCMIVMLANPNWHLQKVVDLEKECTILAFIRRQLQLATSSWVWLSVSKFFYQSDGQLLFWITPPHVLAFCPPGFPSFMSFHNDAICQAVMYSGEASLELVLGCLDWCLGP